jgi:hypothetical protein
MFLGLLARLADPIQGLVTAHAPGMLAAPRAQRRALRTRRQVLADRRARGLT